MAPAVKILIGMVAGGALGVGWGYLIRCVGSS
jgi:hypothetical protein